MFVLLLSKHINIKLVMAALVISRDSKLKKKPVLLSLAISSW